MIVLDTNIISELMKKEPAPTVIKWFNQQETLQLFITTITLAEISYGIDVLPISARKNLLEHAFHEVIKKAFKHRILGFNELAAYQYGKLMGHRKKAGRPISILDGQIASIALSNGMSLATRNTNDFVDCGLDLMNPFDV